MAEAGESEIISCGCPAVVRKGVSMATISAVPQTRIAGGSFLLEERSTEETFTPEDFSEQHRLIAQTAEEFAANEIVPQIDRMEHKDFAITRALLKKAGEL